MATALAALGQPVPDAVVDDAVVIVVFLVIAPAADRPGVGNVTVPATAQDTVGKVTVSALSPPTVAD